MDTQNTGYLIITRRPFERLHIGNRVIQFEGISKGVGKFRVLDPSHTFFLHPGFSIQLFSDVIFHLIDLLPIRAKIGIEAPRNIKILREELIASIDKGKIS